jgi:PadR family transcriptional regulator PadR
MDDRSQWLRGVLELSALAVLVHGEQHGYALATELERSGLGTVKGGTLYPMLARLERDGLVEARWGPGEAGPARKYYAITDVGRLRVRDGTTAWLQFVHDVSSLLRGATDAMERTVDDRSGVPGSADPEPAGARRPPGAHP